MAVILNDYFDNLAKQNRISHAFLLCNTNYNNIKEELNNIISKYFFDNQNIDENFVDLKIIRPTNDKILKDDIIMLQNEFKTKSQYNKNKVYIIDNVEKLNEYASNSLLKFLEEPEENIYAFLISENINKVLPTIKSRCQILFINSNDNFNISNYENDLIEKTINFIKLFEKINKNIEGHLYEILNKKEDKENITKFIEIMKYFYLDVLYYKINKNIEYFKNYNIIVEEISKNLTQKNIVNKLIIINKLENELNYNLNINLYLDKLIFMLGDVKNE